MQGRLRHLFIHLTPWLWVCWSFPRAPSLCPFRPSGDNVTWLVSVPEYSILSYVGSQEPVAISEKSFFVRCSSRPPNLRRHGLSGTLMRHSVGMRGKGWHHYRESEREGDSPSCGFL